MEDPNAQIPPPPQPVPVSMMSQPPPRPRSAWPFLLIGCFLFMALLFGGIVVAVALGKSATVERDAILRMTITGELPEYVRAQGLDELFGTKPVTVRQHVFNLQKAAADKRIKGVLLRIEQLQAGFAKVEELRDALVTFKKSGKFVIAYAESLTEKEYALLLAADEIIMPPDSRFELNGFATDYSHYPGLLEKLGIEVQYFRYGKYKSGSGEQFGRKAFTEPVKEMINENLKIAFNAFVDGVAKYRKVDRANVVQWVNESGEKAEWALEKKLIDKIAYWDEVEAELRQKVGAGADEKLKWVSAAKYRDVEPSAAGLTVGRHTFALIYSVGLIVAGKGGGSDPFGGESTQGSQPIINALRKAVDDDEVKAIILRVDSPGGAGLGCDYVRREIEKLREKKPIIVSMSDVAASGGYWISMDATGIVAQPTTYTGSIGIFSVVPSLGGLYEKLDLNNEVFKQGEHADAIIGARKMTDDEAKKFDADLFTSYTRFVTLAAKGRKKTPEQMEQLAQGRTWMGAQAIENGLIDRLGGFDAAIELGKEKAGLAADETVSLRLFDKHETFFEQLARAGEDEDPDEATDFGSMVVKRAVEQSGYGPLLKSMPVSSAFVRQVVTHENTMFPLMEYQPTLR